MPVAAESCGRYFCIDRSLRSKRAVVAFALTSQCEDIVRSLKFKRAVNLIRILSQFLQS